MIKIKKIKPMFTALITTMDKYEDYQKMSNGLYDASKQVGTVKEYQRVLAVGGSVREIQVGDLVSINPTRFSKMKHKEGGLKDGVIEDNTSIGYEFDIIKLDDKDCLLLQDRDIEFIIEEFEEVEDAPKTNIIHPPKKTIIIP